MKTLQIAPGDAFLVPDRASGLFVVGRVISDTALNGRLVELFDRRFGEPSEVIPDALGDPLFAPFLQAFRFTAVPKWTRLRGFADPDPDEPRRRGIDLTPPIEVWFPERTERRVAGEIPTG